MFESLTGCVLYVLQDTEYNGVWRYMYIILLTGCVCGCGWLFLTGLLYQRVMNCTSCQYRLFTCLSATPPLDCGGETNTHGYTHPSGFNGLYQHISFVFLSFCFYQKIILRQMKERRWYWTVSCLGTLLSLDRPSTITPGILMKRMYMHTDTHTLERICRFQIILKPFWMMLQTSAV